MNHIDTMKQALRVALENLDSMESLGPTTEAVIDAAQKWYLAEQPAVQEEPARTIEDLLGHLSDVLDDSEFEKIDIRKWNAAAAIVGITRLAAPQPAQPQGTCGHESCDCRSYCKKQQPAQPQQEPVAWMTKDGEIYKHECWPEYEARPLVFGDTSPQEQRKPLTDDQITQVANETYGPTSEWEVEQIRLDFARAIEAAHGIKGDA